MFSNPFPGPAWDSSQERLPLSVKVKNQGMGGGEDVSYSSSLTHRLTVLFQKFLSPLLKNSEWNFSQIKSLKRNSLGSLGR